MAVEACYWGLRNDGQIGRLSLFPGWMEEGVAWDRPGTDRDSQIAGIQKANCHSLTGRFLCSLYLKTIGESS